MIKRKKYDIILLIFSLCVPEIISFYILFQILVLVHKRGKKMNLCRFFSQVDRNFFRRVNRAISYYRWLFNHDVILYKGISNKEKIPSYLLKKVNFLKNKALLLIYAVMCCFRIIYAN